MNLKRDLMITESLWSDMLDKEVEHTYLVKVVDPDKLWSHVNHDSGVDLNKQVMQLLQATNPDGSYLTLDDLGLKVYHIAVH